LYLLGSPRIECDGVPVTVPRRKALALLVYLAVSGQSQSRDTLATLLWPEQSQSRARASLRSTLSILRRDLGAGLLDAEREAVHFDTEAEVWLDVAEFRARLAACRAHDHPSHQVCPACLSALAKAVALYHDDLLAGFTLRDCPAFDEWQFFQGEGLRQELASALERLVRGHVAQSAYESALPYARRWLALDSLHEPAHRALMRLYARSGQRAAALRQYAECERVLQEELGAAPEVETADLYQAIRERRDARSSREEKGDLAPSGTTESRVVASPQEPPNNLPASVTPFIGRQAPLAEVRALLTRPEVRLLTLTGAGGTGKTRLALEAAAGLLPTYSDGVFFVPMAPLGDPRLVLPAIATALEVRELAGRSPLAALQQALRDKQLLLVVDNLEHLLPAAPALVELLSAAPGLNILATSRAPLQVYAEFEYMVLPMIVPHADDLPPLDRFAEVETVQLFTQRVRAVRADFCLDERNAPAVAEICARLDGLPLAIELAAAWARVLAPDEIAREVRRGLDFLESERRDVPVRQRSMRAVFDHSWSLLSPHEREVLQVAALFRGGCTRRAAERVAGATLRDLRSLVARSLLQRTAAPLAIQGQPPLEPRCEIHELFRQYAQGKLDEGPRAGEGRDRHCTFFCAALEEWGEALKGSGQVRALSELGAEVGNARAAWEWAAQRGYVERLDQGMDGLCRFYRWRGRYQEGETACRLAEEALMVPGDPTAAAAPGDRVRVLAKAVLWRAVFAQAAAHVDHVIPLLERGLAYLAQSESSGVDVRRERAFALQEMGNASFRAGREDARQWDEQSLALYRELGDRWGVARVLRHLGGQVLGSGGIFREGEVLVRESLAIWQSLGDQRGIARSRQALGTVVGLQGRLVDCERLMRQSLDAFQAVGDPVDAAEVFAILGFLLLFLGRPEEAHEHVNKSAAIVKELGLRDWLAAYAFKTRGDVALWLGRYTQARHYAETGLALARSSGKHTLLAQCHRCLGMLEIVQGNDARAEQVLREGVAIAQRVRDFNADSCAALAGLAAVRQGRADQARRDLYEGLAPALARDSYLSYLYGLPPAAALMVAEGQIERAVELYALALQQPFVSSSRCYEDVVGRQIDAAAATLPPEVVAAARERGQARDLETTVRELVDELGEVKAA
jgi:predicted ATPase/DNA-binding SARP family transcriptional activator